MVNTKALLILVGIGILAYAFLGGSEIFKEKNKVSCNIRVDNMLGLPPGIESANCKVIGTCKKFFSINTLSVIDANVKVLLKAEGDSDSRNIVVSNVPGVDTKVNLEICVGKETTNGVVELKNKGGNLITSKNVAW